MLRTDGRPEPVLPVMHELSQHDCVVEGYFQTGPFSLNRDHSSKSVALTAQRSRLLFSLLMAAIVSAAFVTLPDD